MPGGLTPQASGQCPSSANGEAAGRGGCLPGAGSGGHTGALESEHPCSLMLVSTMGVRKVISLSFFKSDRFKCSTSLSCV